MTPHRSLFTTATWSYAFAGLLQFVSLLLSGPTLAQAQVVGKSTANFSVASHVTKTSSPQAPTQMELPPPPPMRYVPGLQEPLVATGATTLKEDADLDAALAAYRSAPERLGPQADFADYAKPLVDFVSQHPDSLWNAAILTDLGCGYYSAGYFTRALTSWQKSWELGRNATSPQAKIMVDRAVGELARMHARLGHEEELESLFADISQRPISGPASGMIQGAREALSYFQHDPGVYLCGPKALRNLLTALKASPSEMKIVDDARSGPHGFSLTQLAALADETKLNYKLIYREAGQPVPVPSVINWKAHHYAAITGKERGRYQVQDPTFGGYAGGVLTAEAIDAESSGYFLVPTSVFDATPNSGWRTVNAGSDEARAVYGMGPSTGFIVGAVTTNDKHLHCEGTGAPGAPIWANLTTDAPQVALQQSSCAPAMTLANAIMMPVSLNLTDTPVGYLPQKGPSARVTLFYNQREDQQPANFSFSNVGPDWTHSWLAYVQDDPNNPGSMVSRYASGGGGIMYPMGSYNSTYGTFTPDTYDNSQLVRIPPTGPAMSYQRNLPDGSTEIYQASNLATSFPRLMFLTQVIDPAGNISTLNYNVNSSNNQVLLTSVTDATGRSTTFTYGMPSYPLLITAITDAFGRSSQATYDSMQRLVSITDPIGITSSFNYGSQMEPNFITALTTPYGTSVFSDALPTGDPGSPETGTTRALTLKDPLGYTEFLYFYQYPGFINPTDPVSTVPTAMGINTINNYLDDRDTFYYDQHAFNYPGAITLNSDGTINTENPYDSHITHWVHDPYDFVHQMYITGRAPESIKPPLENRVWYNYPNQPIICGPDGNGPCPVAGGTLDRPSAAGRVLVDGPTQQQVSTATYNTCPTNPITCFGKPTSLTDPLGRMTTFTYAANNINLLAVQQNAASGAKTIASFTYNTKHEPVTYTGADGQVWHYAYNSAGQLTSISDPNSGVTSFAYDSIGRLVYVQDANQQTFLTLTYDSADRVRTRTDSQGYVLTYSYDNLDRVTQILYPDGTTDLYNYNFPNGTPSLELRKHTDRLGRVTTYGYDADRRLTSVTEPISSGVNRTTSYDYYENGVLKNITDANGNVTHWDIDLESRPVSKTYAYGTPNAETETLMYEATTSRLMSLTDALAQVKSYIYAVDDRLTGITYTNTVNPTPNVTFAYDAFFPRLTSMTDGTGTSTYTYTAIGTNGALQLASENGPFNNDSIGYTYDALGRLSTRTIPGANEGFTYDAISRLTSHSTGLGTFNYSYLGETGQTTSRSVTNGGVHISSGWTYDTNTNGRRLIRITNSGETRSYSFSYLIPGGGGANNPYEVQGLNAIASSPLHPFSPLRYVYGYDFSDRLLFATLPSLQSPYNYRYRYDLLDNATSVTDGQNQTQATYNGLNEISTWGSNNYFYDLDGNLLSGDGTHTYKWDAENQLVEIDYVGSNQKNQFAYDGLGRRIVGVDTAPEGGTTTTRYLWCEDGRVCQTRDGGDNVMRRFTVEGELLVGAGQKLIYMPDQLGSARDILDGTTGGLVAAYDFTPYGSIARSYGNTNVHYPFAGLFVHPGQATLNFATYRQLDGVTGRFLNRDPIRENGGTNLYSYVQGSPVGYYDPIGLDAKDSFYALGLGVRNSYIPLGPDINDHYDPTHYNPADRVPSSVPRPPFSLAGVDLAAPSPSGSSGNGQKSNPNSDSGGVKPCEPDFPNKFPWFPTDESFPPLAPQEESSPIMWRLVFPGEFVPVP